jgi:PDZ domain
MYLALVPLAVKCIAEDSASTGVSAASQSVADRQVPTASQIGTWIAQLDSNRYLERERATQELVAAGPAAFDALLTAANGDRPEPADRSIWILTQVSRSDDLGVAMAALDRLVQVENRPNVVSDARRAQTNIRLRMCQDALEKLGGRLTVRSALPLGVVNADSADDRLICVELDKAWKGNPDDLRCLTELDQPYFRLEGSAVGDAEVKIFETMSQLLQLQLYHTQVTPDAVDAIKAHQPNAIVYVRNLAFLGIQGDSRSQAGGNAAVPGVRVVGVQPGTAAAAGGILAEDVITAIGGYQVPDFDRLTARIGQYQPNETVDVTLIRNDMPLTLQVKLGQWPAGSD